MKVIDLKETCEVCGSSNINYCYIKQGEKYDNFMGKVITAPNNLIFCTCNVCHYEFDRKPLNESSGFDRKPLNESSGFDIYLNNVDNLATDQWGGAGPDCSTERQRKPQKDSIEITKIFTPESLKKLAIEINAVYDSCAYVPFVAFEEVMRIIRDF